MMILLAIPAAIQLGIIGGLCYLAERQESEVERLDHARKVHDSINQLIKDLYRIVSLNDVKALLEMGQAATGFEKEQASIYKQYAVLKELLKGDNKDLIIVQSSEKYTLQAMAIVQQLKEIASQEAPQSRLELKPLFWQLRHLTQKIVSDDMIDLAGKQADIEASGPVIQRKMNAQTRWFIVIGGLLSLLSMAVVALFLALRVAVRVDRILENSDNVAKGRPLLPPDQGADEIASLDRSFHEMARTIKELSDKNTVVVDNAADMICSMDENGVITSVNAAGGKLFGCHQADLIGKSFRDLVHRQDSVQLSNYLQLVRAEVSGKPVQLRLVGRGKGILFVLWSAKWTSADNQYFSVIRDLTKIHEAQRMKQEVLGIITNDLQKPLANLQNFVDLLEEGSIAQISERGKRFVDSAKTNVNQLSLLIDDMLDLEQAKAGLQPPKFETLPLDTLVDKAQLAVASFAEQKGVVLDCRRSGLSIKGEEDKLVRVFVNLLDNAIDHSPRGSSIMLVSKSEDGFAQISITDKGPDLPTEALATIFDAYNRHEVSFKDGSSEESDKIQNQSSSLAMAISKAFVELHGGYISANSRTGDGTTITFTLPLALAVELVPTE